MRTAILETEGHLVLTEASRPLIEQPDQVLVQTKAVGICGSEVHAFQGTHPYRKAPTVLGHEMAGVVAEVGAKVEAFRVGDRVFVDPQWTCGDCEYCRNGMLNLCPDKKVLGTPAWPGGFGEFVVVPQQTLFGLPAHLSFAQGSLIEPLTVGVHVARRAGLRAGESVAVLGSGSIGGMVCAVSRALGADPIIAADIRQHCLDAAIERLGATHDILLPGDGLVEQVMTTTKGQGVDVAFVTADDAQLVDQAVHLVKRRGRVIIISLITEEPLTLRAYDILSREISLIGSSMCNHDDVRRAIELAAAGQVDVEGILTHVLPIEQAQHGIELAQSKDDGAIKVVLTFD
jgi:L-iditol 2-dehydrogenase